MKNPENYENPQPEEEPSNVRRLRQFIAMLEETEAEGGKNAQIVSQFLTRMRQLLLELQSQKDQDEKITLAIRDFFQAAINKIEEKYQQKVISVKDKNEQIAMIETLKDAYFNSRQRILNRAFDEIKRNRGKVGF